MQTSVFDGNSLVRKYAMRLIALCTQVTIVCLLCLSIAGYAGRLRKLAELSAHFKIQYLFGSLVCLLLFLLFRSWLWLFVAVVCCAVNLAAIAPWYLSPTAATLSASSSGRRLRFMLANVNYANTQYARLIDLVEIEQPDILVLQEVDERWIKELMNLESRYAFHRAAPHNGDGSGIALYSRLPLEDARVVRLGSEEDVERPGIAARVVVGSKRRRR